MPVTRIGRLANFGGEVVTYPVLHLLCCPALFVLFEWRWPLYIKVEVVGTPAVPQHWVLCGSVSQEVATEGLGFPTGDDLITGFQPHLALSLGLVCGCLAMSYSLG